MIAALLLAAAYLCGSLPTGPLLARARGVDLARVGSGSTGATNVARALGKPLGLLVLVVDTLKGLGPALVARLVGASPALAAAVGLTAVLAHVFPVWLRFRGGKGVATAFGVFLALLPVAALAAGAVYALVVAVTRLSSLGSLLAATTLVVAAALLAPPAPILGLAAVAWLVIVASHRANIRRLLRREEPRI